jgi:hypothetical protein
VIEVEDICLWVEPYSWTIAHRKEEALAKCSGAGLVIEVFIGRTGATAPVQASLKESGDCPGLGIHTECMFVAKLYDVSLLVIGFLDVRFLIRSTVFVHALELLG